MHSRFIPQSMTYTGAQLRAHYIYKEFGILGDAMISFIGPCEVEEELVDWVDRKSGAVIRSRKMVHFLVEHFGIPLEVGIWRLRTLISLIQERINQKLGSRLRRTSLSGLWRSGNDLYDGKKKLSVAIATASPMSVLMHVGVNVETIGTPIPTVGLSMYKVAPVPFAQAIMGQYAAEVDRVRTELAKVRFVPEVA